MGIRITDHFDLIAGTSTGGIIALGLGLGMRPRDLVDFYVQYGPRIFRDPMRLRGLLQLIVRKYPSYPLELALRAVFENRRFGESEKRLVIASYNLGEDDVYLFRTPHAERLRRDFKAPAWQVALATAAAPTYFPVCRAVDDLRLVDGGVWANNPAMVAVTESFGTLHVPLEQTWLLSIGTYDPVARRPAYLNKGGMAFWATSATGIILRAGSIGVNNQVRYLLGPDHVLRVDPKVPAEDVVLDTAEGASGLIARARHYSRIFMPAIQEKFIQHTAAPYTPLYS